MAEPTPTYFERRLGHRALSLALAQFNLGDIVIKLNPDDPRQALFGLRANAVSFFEDFDGGRGQLLALVTLLGNGRARVQVPQIERLIRWKRRREFVAEEVGIVHRRGQPDLDLVVDLTEELEQNGEILRKARPRPVVQRAERGPVGPTVLPFRGPM